MPLTNYKVWRKGEDESDAGTVREGSPEEAAESDSSSTKSTAPSTK